MKKVILVDDEILIREVIRDTIQWEKEGFIYCGGAPDGEVALPMIEEFRPDILITDIKMPFMDGLELSSIVRERFPEIKIVIISGHGEFEYARTALRLGIEEYCVKPFGSADLLEILQRVSDKIDKERQAKEQIEHRIQEHGQNGTLSQSKLLNELCSGFITTSEAVHLSSKLQIDLLSQYYAVVVSDLRSITAPASPPEDISELMKQQEEELHVKYASEQTLMFKRSITECVWILKGDSPEQLQQELESFLHVQNQLTDDLPYTLSIGLGSIQDQMQGIHTSFLDAMEDMHWRRISHQNLQALRESNQVAPEQSIFLDRTKFVEFLKIGSPYLNHLTEQYWSRKSSSTDRYGELLSKVKHHIHEQYDKFDFSLQNIADHVNLSPGHLSKIFSQEMGQTFIEYLTQTRIQKAMELLQSTQAKSYEIAFMVGYNDANYFSNLFKRVTGMTTMQFRRSGQFRSLADNESVKHFVYKEK
ncbi:response regulator [Paenibacillus aceris]|uniref:Two-component system response regulator YesN n=1 Tax=Paenibacillus aceris TaxID=869555 RepID=A0ABS4IAC3_9BACL|nr:response regulator [Paenibacillus aceris]MBP1967858.1 two-component system response regulator YesN [Paenibacillus aceris]NHW37584.1 response regulator [Paenibacillus aceris]